MSCSNEIRMLRALHSAALDEVSLARQDDGEKGALRMIALARIFDTAATTLACQDKAIIDKVFMGSDEMLGPLGGGGE